MQIGTHGTITTTGYRQADETGKRTKIDDTRKTKPDVWKSHTRFRDHDGETRLIERWGTTKAKAETALKAAIADRQVPVSAGEWHAGMGLTAAADLWLEQVDRSDRSDSTKRQYRDNTDRYLRESVVKGLTLREVNKVGTVERYLQGVADNSGAGAAKTARTVLSGVLSEAVRHGVLPHNVCRDVRPAKPKTPKASVHDTERAFTREDREAVLKVAERDDNGTDTADLLHFLAGTGVRIEEALSGVYWSGIDLEADMPTVHVRGTKTQTADRVLPLPAWLADRLRERAAKYGTSGLVFGMTRYDTSPKGNPKGSPRDRRNVGKHVAKRMADAGVPWATSHTFRRTVATWMDEAGAPLAEIANQLGHANVNVTAGYLGRRTAPSRAADVL